MKMLRSIEASTDPDRLNAYRVEFTVSRTTVGPAAMSVSGGAMIPWLMVCACEIPGNWVRASGGSVAIAGIAALHPGAAAEDPNAGRRAERLPRTAERAAAEPRRPASPKLPARFNVRAPETAEGRCVNTWNDAT